MALVQFPNPIYLLSVHTTNQILVRIFLNYRVAVLLTITYISYFFQPNEAKKSKASPDKNGSTTQDNEEKPATESKTAAAETKLAAAAAPAVNGAAAMAGLLAAYSDSDDSENEN